MIKKDFWDSVKEYIDAKIGNSSQDISDLLKSYDWNALNIFAKPDIQKILKDVTDSNVITMMKGAMTDPMKALIIDAPNQVQHVAATVAGFEEKYLGANAVDPTTTPNGSPMTEGVVYWNTALKEFRVFDGVHWKVMSGSAAAANMTPTHIKALYETNPDTNPFTDAEQTKLQGTEVGATADQTPAEIAQAIGSVANANLMTDAEKAKLAGVTVSDHFKGRYATSADLIANNTTGNKPGDYAFVAAAGKEDIWIWNDATTTPVWEKANFGSAGMLTAAQIKTKYESNTDTNALSDANLDKLTKLTLTKPFNADTVDSLKHTHSNKAVLDKIQEPFMTTDKTKLANLHDMPANALGYLLNDGNGTLTWSPLTIKGHKLIGEAV